GVFAIAYETVAVNRTLPLLTPMSEVAGRMAAQIGAQFLQKFNGGQGILLAGVPGVSRGKVTIIGGGIVGTNAAKMAIGLGGIVGTSDHVTTHDNPTFVKHGVVHYSVANMPGAVPRTSTIALTNVTVPYALQIANKGVYSAIKENNALKLGVNVANGEITHE